MTTLSHLLIIGDAEDDDDDDEDDDGHCPLRFKMMQDEDENMMLRILEGVDG